MSNISNYFVVCLNVWFINCRLMKNVRFWTVPIWLHHTVGGITWVSNNITLLTRISCKKKKFTLIFPGDRAWEAHFTFFMKNHPTFFQNNTKLHYNLAFLIIWKIVHPIDGLLLVGLVSLKHRLVRLGLIHGIKVVLWNYNPSPSFLNEKKDNL